MATEDSTDDSPFETVADTRKTTIDVYQQIFEQWVLTPFRILWSDYRGRIGLVIVSLYLFMGTVGVWLYPIPSHNQGDRLVGMFQTLEHPLGTDGMGQDMLGLMIHATPDMLKMMIAGALVANGVAAIVGVISGYKGGFIDKALMTVTDVMMSIPGLPLMLILAAVFEPRNPYLVGIILNIQGWSGMARALRSQVLPMRDEGYVEASRAMGLSQSNIMLKDIMPSLAPYFMINFIGGAAGIVSSAVALYFLGILPFTNLNWGVVLNMAYERSGALYSTEAAHWLFVPLVTLTGLTFGLTLLAQATDRIFNPRLRSRHMEGGEEPDEEELADAQGMASEATMRT